MKIIALTQIRRQSINISGADRRMYLHFALSQFCGACPPDLLTWLKIKYPVIHQEITECAPQAINSAWGTGNRRDFSAAISHFMDAISVAIAVHQLKGRRQ